MTYEGYQGILLPRPKGPEEHSTLKGVGGTEDLTGCGSGYR